MRQNRSLDMRRVARSLTSGDKASRDDGLPEHLKKQATPSVYINNLRYSLLPDNTFPITKVFGPVSIFRDAYGMPVQLIDNMYAKLQPDQSYSYTPQNTAPENPVELNDEEAIRNIYTKVLKFEPRFVNHLHLQLGESAVDLLNGVINTLVSFCTGYANEETKYDTTIPYEEVQKAIYMEYAGKLRDSCISFASNHVASCGHQVKRQPIDESAWSVMRPGDPLEIKVKEVEECLNQGLNGGVTFSPAAVLFVTEVSVAQILKTAILLMMKINTTTIEAVHICGAVDWVDDLRDSFKHCDDFTDFKQSNQEAMDEFARTWFEVEKKRAEINEQKLLEELSKEKMKKAAKKKEKKKKRKQTKKTGVDGDDDDSSASENEGSPAPVSAPQPPAPQPQEIKPQEPKPEPKPVVKQVSPPPPPVVEPEPVLKTLPCPVCSSLIEASAMDAHVDLCLKKNPPAVAQQPTKPSAPLTVPVQPAKPANEWESVKARKDRAKPVQESVVQPPRPTAASVVASAAPVQSAPTAASVVASAPPAKQKQAAKTIPVATGAVASRTVPVTSKAVLQPVSQPQPAQAPLQSSLFGNPGDTVRIPANLPPDLRERTVEQLRARGLNVEEIPVVSSGQSSSSPPLPQAPSPNVPASALSPPAPVLEQPPTMEERAADNEREMAMRSMQDKLDGIQKDLENSRAEANYFRDQNVQLSLDKETLRQSFTARSNQYESLLKLYASLRHKHICLTCMERQTDMVLLPCRHLTICSECYSSRQGSSRVMLCNCCSLPVEAVLKVYFAPDPVTGSVGDDKVLSPTTNLMGSEMSRDSFNRVNSDPSPMRSDLYGMRPSSDYGQFRPGPNQGLGLGSLNLGNIDFRSGSNSGTSNDLNMNMYNRPAPGSSAPPPPGLGGLGDSFNRSSVNDPFSRPGDVFLRPNDGYLRIDYTENRSASSGPAGTTSDASMMMFLGSLLNGSNSSGNGSNNPTGSMYR